MPNDRQGRADLDQLARAFPGWLGEKALHGVGWLVVGLGYVVFLGVWLGGCQLLWSRFFPSDEWLARQNVLLLLALGVGGSMGVFFGMALIGMLVGSVVASLGAYIADPHAERAFGTLAPKPGIRLGGGTPDTVPRWFISAAGRRRLKQASEEARIEWEAGYAEEKVKEQADILASARELVRVCGRERVETFKTELEHPGSRPASRLDDTQLTDETKRLVRYPIDLRNLLVAALDEALAEPARLELGVGYMELVDRLDGKSSRSVLDLLQDGAEDRRDQSIRDAEGETSSGQGAYVAQIVAACNSDRAARLEVLRAIVKKAERDPYWSWPSR